MKHTKGNWKVYNAHWPGVECTTPDNFRLSIVVVGVNEDDLCGIQGSTQEEAYFNAKLIAAAPELLETLMDIKSQIPTLWGDGVIDEKLKLTLMADTIDRIEQAIKKATE